MAAPPCDQLGHVVASDLGEKFVLAEEVDQVTKLALGVVCPRVMLPDLDPIAVSNVV